MSRCILKPKNADHAIAVGIDPPLQCWFVQVFDLNHEKIKEEEKLLVNLDSGSRWPIIKAIKEYAEPNNPYNMAVIDSISMDLDPQVVPLELKLESPVK